MIKIYQISKGFLWRQWKRADLLDVEPWTLEHFCFINIWLRPNKLFLLVYSMSFKYFLYEYCVLWMFKTLSCQHVPDFWYVIHLKCWVLSCVYYYVLLRNQYKPSPAAEKISCLIHKVELPKHLAWQNKNTQWKNAVSIRLSNYM